VRFVVLEVPARDVRGQAVERIGFLPGMVVPPGTTLLERVRSGTVDNALAAVRRQSERRRVPLIDMAAGEEVVYVPPVPF